ncbi:Cd2+/Zn2+-exporting ATPase [Halanaerobium saccharolyticum]|uniref:Cd(2+)-exporting ATPase n=1 Tax=Halanaerobium saccharolyticum TaxID=43595 RepID=A0A4R7Z965_9FIRM|nr:heavy metal translocating P-type ATPase [Halanaerobium saccharolyticum]RAK09398.1 Cd2+/Zn2+-exporting ATPase [Halanaerobium saccharolyticum]TDW06257.1 Cd2+/Zn2+-exporting ATPase [Halanaerobium saccharolyticum]TDX61051.1 Cd2+/Zn2+-exporting ATPase [Halanaerobium saccharolyticum]
MQNTVEKKEKNEKEFELEGLSCSNCALKIEDQVKQLEGMENVELNFATSTLKVAAEESRLDKIKEELQKISDQIEPGVKVKDKGGNQKDNNQDNFSLKDYLWGKKNIFIGALFFVFALSFSHLNLFANTIFNTLALPAYITAYFLIGYPVLKSAVLNIGRGQIFDENFLMVIATIGAFGIREYPEAVAVMLFYMVGELFQERAVNNSRRSIKDLMDIQAEYANLVKDEEIIKVEPEQLNVGDLIAVKAGEKIPVDGKIVSGETALETSALTGESLPKDVAEGDQVLSGMINLNKLITVKVTKEYKNSTVKKILELVENASSKKAPTEQFITKFARYYTPFVVLTAALVAVLPPLFTGAAFSPWFYRALVFLVVSCPCALVVSIPLGFFGGIGLSSKNGILVKGGNYLEALNELDSIIFDKTGTLTEGDFKVTEVNIYSDHSREEILNIAAEAEQFSNHPIAQSIVEAAGDYKKHSADSDYQEISGAGIKAVLGNNKILAGNERLMQKNNINIQKSDSTGTAVYLAQNGQFLASIIISDQLKKDAVDAISSLKNMGIKNLAMLTGDNELTAAEVASKLGLDNYYAGLLPDQKVEKVEELLSKSKKLAFVGDGINDAPVLARSDLGIAMGGLGSDAAVEAADVVLMTDEPSKIVTALNIAAKTKRLVWQNIIMALSIKAVVMILSIFGMASMWAAVFADVGVALMAVFNVMRILKTDNI